MSILSHDTANCHSKLNNWPQVFLIMWQLHCDSPDHIDLTILCRCTYVSGTYRLEQFVVRLTLLAVKPIGAIEHASEVVV